MKKIISGLIGGLILWSIINFIVKPSLEGDKNSFTETHKTNLELFRKNECRLFSMSIQECTYYKETGEFPARLKKQKTAIKVESKKVKKKIINNFDVKTGYSCVLKDANNIDTTEWTITTDAISKVGMVVGSGNYLVENSCCPEKGKRLAIYGKDAKLRWFDLTDENLYSNLIEISDDKIKHKKLSLKLKSTEIERFNKLFNGAESAKKSYNDNLVSVNSYIGIEEKFFYSANASFKNNNNSNLIFDGDCK